MTRYLFIVRGRQSSLGTGTEEWVRKVHETLGRGQKSSGIGGGPCCASLNQSKSAIRECFPAGTVSLAEVISSSLTAIPRGRHSSSSSQCVDD